jgi:hypothetical protein
MEVDFLMAAFSTQRGLFGAPMNPATPPIMPEPTPAAPAYQRPGTGQMIAGLIGDALLNWSGGQAQFAPTMQAQRQAALDAQGMQLKRAQDFADFKRRLDYERANPKPVNNDTAADYEFWKARLTPEQFAAYVENKVNPPQLMMTPQGIVSVPRSGGGHNAPAASGPAPGAVEGGYRFKGGNPADPNAWEPVAGGPTPGASGGFR